MRGLNKVTLIGNLGADPDYQQLEVYTLKAQPVNSLSADRLCGYFLYCVNTLKLSENTLHSRINAVKFYFE